MSRRGMGTTTRQSEHLYCNADLAWLPYFRQMSGDKPPDDFVSNGATWSPDVVCGIDIRPAAHFHDYAYSSLHRCDNVHDEASRYQADQLFLCNLRTCGIGLIAWVYYFRVRLWGHTVYTYSPGMRPPKTLCFWLRLFFGRYLSW